DGDVVRGLVRNHEIELRIEVDVGRRDRVRPVLRVRGPSTGERRRRQASDRMVTLFEVSFGITRSSFASRLMSAVAIAYGRFCAFAVPVLANVAGAKH